MRRNSEEPLDRPQQAEPGKTRDQPTHVGPECQLSQTVTQLCCCVGMKRHDA